MLGGGRNRGAPEWGGVTVNGLTLRRTRYGARLARETGCRCMSAAASPRGRRLAEGH